MPRADRRPDLKNKKTKRKSFSVENEGRYNFSKATLK